MKTTLLTLASIFVTGAAIAQCVPEIGMTGAGFAFSSTPLEPVYACADCGDYERVFSLKTFVDTTLSVEISPGNPPLDVTVIADFFRLDSIGGLPAGLTYTTNSAFDTTYDAVDNPFGYWINPGDTTNGFMPTTGCVTISGSAAAWTAAAGGGPNNDGIYPLAVYIDVMAVDFVPQAIGDVVGYNTWLSDMGFLLPAFGDPNFTTNGIRYEGPSLEVIASALGINDNASSRFGMVSNHPNPFTGNTTITFEMKEEGSNLQFAVYDVLGNLVSSKTLVSTVGNNRVNFSSNGLSAGIYVYTLSDGNSILTRRMNVQ